MATVPTGILLILVLSLSAHATLFSKSGNANVEDDWTSCHDEETRNSIFGCRLTSKEGCDLCKIMVGTIQHMVAEKRPQDDIVDAVAIICIEAKVHDERICKYFVKQYMGISVGIVERVNLTTDQICSFMMPSCGTAYDPSGMWNVTLPDTPKPPVVPPVHPEGWMAKMNFLQFTDIHIDMMYQPGSNAQCGEPMCCRSDDGPPAPGVAGAGLWGDYRGCDLPISLAHHMFQSLVRDEEEYEFILFTGDISAHDDWNQTRTDQLDALARLTDMFDYYFPKIPVYFCVGNHDSSPEGSYPPPYITGEHSQSWMYEAMAQHWGRWLPQDAQATILKAGYYTVLVHPGFRIISLNNVFCYHGNWWMILNTTDPAGQLAWLVDTLQAAEDKGEKVFILAHIPTDCLKAWSWNYYKIISRYESTIVGQFNGHTHTDKFKMYYDVHNLTRPVGVSFVAGSVTPISDKNPNYRKYIMDGVRPNSTFSVLYYEDHIFDLRKNTGPNATWELEYTPMTDYDMPTIYPQDWHNLIYRMKSDDNLFQQFYKHIYKGGVFPPCTGSCKTKVLCDLKTARTGDTELCKDLYE